MKTKDLIAELQEADPSGELECCIENVDIFSVATEPAYWDGRLQLLTRDPAKKPYFDVIGGKYTSKGAKVVISPMSITDVLWDNPDAVIDYSEVGGSADRYRVSDDETRKASRDVELKVEMDAFHRWVKSKADVIRPENSDKCRGGSDAFYEKHLSPKDPVKELPTTEKDGMTWHASWNDRRNAWWDDTLEVYWRGGWGIRKKDGSVEVEP